jgi:hypothetical protein
MDWHVKVYQNNCSSALSSSFAGFETTPHRSIPCPFTSSFVPSEQIRLLVDRPHSPLSTPITEALSPSISQLSRIGILPLHWNSTIQLQLRCLQKDRKIKTASSGKKIRQWPTTYSYPTCPVWGVIVRLSHNYRSTAIQHALYGEYGTPFSWTIKVSSDCQNNLRNPPPGNVPHRASIDQHQPFHRRKFGSRQPPVSRICKSAPTTERGIS